jgi:iron(III) transport system substrate-binding protein
MRIRSNSALRWCIVALTLTACTPEPAVDETPPTEPVVVYAAYTDKTYLPTLFTRFTAETGQIVLVRNGQVPGIVDDVIANRVSPSADLLLTPSVYGVWRAAEEGQLRPHYSEIVDNNAPTWLRDPDNYWVALSYSNAVMVYNSDEFSAADLPTYEGLAEARFRRKLCLSTSSLAINRSVVGMLIRKLGARQAELAVRGWIANLAMPVFESEEHLLRAMGSGECAIGLLASNVVALGANSTLKVHIPVDPYSTGEAIGITRHAHNPDGAAKLIDWMLQQDVQSQHAAHSGALSVANAGRKNTPVIYMATMYMDAQQLAERARYR